MGIIQLQISNASQIQIVRFGDDGDSDDSNSGGQSTGGHGSHEGAGAQGANVGRDSDPSASSEFDNFNDFMSTTDLAKDYDPNKDYSVDIGKVGMDVMGIEGGMTGFGGGPGAEQSLDAATINSIDDLNTEPDDPDNPNRKKSGLAPQIRAINSLFGLNIPDEYDIDEYGRPKSLGGLLGAFDYDKAKRAFDLTTKTVGVTTMDPVGSMFAGAVAGTLAGVSGVPGGPNTASMEANAEANADQGGKTQDGKTQDGKTGEELLRKQASVGGFTTTKTKDDNAHSAKIAALEAADKIRRSFGRNKTILTGGSGILGTPLIRKRTILGV